MVETYQDLGLLVDELRECYQHYRHDSAITAQVQSIVRPWVENPRWITDQYRHCITDEDIYPLYENGKDDILITVICWRKGQEGCVHDHNTWAVIGVAQGQETHRIWRRTDDCSRDGFATVEPVNRVTAVAGQVLSLPEDGIHSVMNDSDEESTIALHVYGGDISKLGRRQYLPSENRYEMMHTMK